MNASLKLKNGIELNFNKFEETICNMLGEINHNIEDLNWGGCGIFAHFTHNELKKYGIDTEIVILNREPIDDKKDTLTAFFNGGYVDDWDLEATSFSHCCIKLANSKFNFDGLDIDVIREWSIRGVKPRGIYSAEEMEAALKYGGWNEDYKRKQNPLLKRIIRKHLKQLTKLT